MRSGRRLPPGKVKLERALSKLGLASRTQARALILEGKVSVGAKTVRDPTFLVVPETARIAIAGQAVAAAPLLTIVVHKPRGLVTTRSDEKGRPTIYSLLGGISSHLSPVGRLDMATSGLILMTNDTRLASWLADPANAIPRSYIVEVRGEVSEATLARMLEGVIDEGELLRARAARALKRSGRESRLALELVTGKNREIRRLCAALGHEVTSLKRIAFGPLELGQLAVGAWREISPLELQKAFPEAPIRLK